MISLRLAALSWVPGVEFGEAGGYRGLPLDAGIGKFGPGARDLH